jgi:asparagine synthase (glutamine-hydrolysing)
MASSALRLEGNRARLSTLCGIVSFEGAPIATSILVRMMGLGNGHGRSALRTETADGAAFAALSRDGFAAEPLVRRGRGAGTVLLAADTRLDNREELLRALGLTAAAISDERLMAAAYERWGEQWHRHLRGAYAAAVYDRAARKLLLLRDRSGERALYWCDTGRSVLFASEPAMLVASGQIGGAPHRGRVLAYLLDVSAEPTWSYFERVHRVPEGCQVRVTTAGFELDRYWDWATVEAASWDGADAAPELARRLEEAVARRLAPQGETGVLLSGGLDSTSVAVQAAGVLQRQGRSLLAFTWTSRSGDGIDETARSRALIASRDNVVEHPIEADALWPLSRYPEAYADPNDPETNAFPDLLLATLEAARERRVRTLMNGIGGDPVAGWLAPELALLLRGRLGTLWRRWRQAGLRHAGILRELRAPTRRRRWPDWLTPEGRRLAREAGLDRSPFSWRGFASRDRFRRTALASPDNAAALERFDRLSRRCGVRVEAPWHDPELAELVLALPDRALAAAPPAKPLLRAAMAETLPAAILDAATKEGRPSSLRARGLLGGGRERIERILSHSRLEEMGLVNGARLLASYREGASRQVIVPGLWEALAAEGWLRAQTGPDASHRGNP